MKKHKKKTVADRAGRTHAGTGPTRSPRADSGGGQAEAVPQSGGRSLDPPVRREMERRFGHDFSRVRIHTDAAAAESAEAMGSHAYTVGQHIVFGERAYAPDTLMGKGLLAHELVHVLQQRSAGPAPGGGVERQATGDAAEREANVVAAQALLGHAAGPESAVSGSARAGELEAPDYLRSAMQTAEHGDPRYQEAMQDFRLQHDDLGLDRYWPVLGEPQGAQAVGPISQLQRVRVASCARSEERTQLEQDLPGNDEMVREIFQFFYPGLSQPTRLTDELRQLAANMLAAAIRGSRAMDYVPRPPSVPSPTWLFTEGVKMAWRRGRDEGIYTAVRNTVANNFRPAFDIAKANAGM